MKAIWNGKVIAECQDIFNVEGNSYFPVQSLNKEYLKDSDTQTACHRKGTESYDDLEIDGKINHNAAWFYPDPSGIANSIKGRVAFCKTVQTISD